MYTLKHRFGGAYPSGVFLVLFTRLVPYRDLIYNKYFIDDGRVDIGESFVSQ
ncbi:hypothetical protein J2W91_001009 [Paenibacillus amylolyticus]|uniref:Uncharacterized protein n=1 Tax=Paenibacillus amylolyticus TaxID=1451 RepID=A0AAP5H062_PAEAM|nr:hypothetical protein [Paenibacillus amylolyticus]